jgi:PAS domain S-box-containing protein
VKKIFDPRRVVSAFNVKNPIDRETEGTGPSLRSPEPNALGRIMVLQNNLQASLGEEQLAGIVVNGLSHLPGVKGCCCCLDDGTRAATDDVTLPESCKTCADGSNAVNACHGVSKEERPGREIWYSLQTQRQVYGRLGIVVTSPSELEPYEPYIAHIAVLIGLRIENGRALAELQTLNRHLEETISGRTASLRESEELYRTLVTASPNAIVVTGETGRIVYASPKAFELFSCPPERKIIGRSILDWVSPGDQDRVLTNFKTAALAKGPRDNEYVFIKEDGSVFVGEVNSAPRLSEEGTLRGLVIIVRDITDRKVQREQLDIARFAIASSINAIGLADLKGSLTYVNHAFLQLWRHTNEADVLGRNISEFIVAEDVVKISDAIRSRGDFFGEGFALREDGSTFNVDISANLVKGLDGKSICLMGAFADISTRKEAETRLRESEERYRVAVESSNDGVILARGDRHIYVNKRFAEMLAYGCDEILDMSIHSLVHPDDRATVAARVEASYRRQLQAPTHSFRLITKDGSERVVEATVTEVTYQGEPAGLVFVRDFTDRLNAERQRETTDEILRELNTIPDIKPLAFRIVTIIQQYLGVDAAVMHLRDGEGFLPAAGKGYSEDFFIPESPPSSTKKDGGRKRTTFCGLIALKHPPLAASFLTAGGSFWTNDMKSVTSALEEDGVEIMDAANYARSGFCSMVLIPLGSGGEIVGLLQCNDGRKDRFTPETIEFLEGIAAFVGLHIIKRVAEEQIRASEEKYRSIFENAIEGIFQRTPEGQLTSVNPALARMHGYESPEELVEAVVSKRLQKPFVDDEVRALYEETLDKRGIVRDFEAEQFRRDGSHFWTLFNSRAVRDRQGSIVCYEGIVTDITERKQLEGQLRQAQKMEAIGTLAGGIAHDFNNLLAVIMGFSNLIQIGMGKDDRLRAYVDQIVAASEKAADLTKSLLAFSRKQRISPKPHDINEAVKNTAKLLRRLLPEDIRLAMELSETTAVVQLDLTQLDQLLMNLTTNARDAMPGGGTLTISTRAVYLEKGPTDESGDKPGRYALLSITDTGCGMDANTKDHVFDPFFTTKETGKGTGLGLASVYGIVKQHGGRISVSSLIDSGTTFNIYLPLTEMERPEEELGGTDPEGGEETILVAEDDGAVRMMVRHILERHGYRVLEAEDGAKAISAHKNHGKPIDLVILDVVMPNKNGQEAFAEMAAHDPNIKALFLSGYTGDLIIDKGLRGDEADFLQKPVSARALLGKVREIMDRKKTQDFPKESRFESR